MVIRERAESQHPHLHYSRPLFQIEYTTVLSSRPGSSSSSSSIAETFRPIVC